MFSFPGFRGAAPADLGCPSPALRAWVPTRHLLGQGFGERLPRRVRHGPPAAHLPLLDLVDDNAPRERDAEHVAFEDADALVRVPRGEGPRKLVGVADLRNLDGTGVGLA